MRYLKPCFPYFLLSLLCFALYLPGIFTIPMDDRDSAHFAQATRQMLETDNYFQIRYQDITRYQKPPGINWLQALSVKAFSTTESDAVWPYRLPSVIGGWLAVLFTFAFVKRFLGFSVAFIASIALASTVLLNVESHLAVIDSSLLFSVVLMQGALWVVYEKSQRNEQVDFKWAALFFLSMSYGFLLKGVTPLVGFLTLLTLSILDKTTLYFKGLRWKWGLLFLLLFSAGWLMALSFAEHTNYLMQMLNKDLFPKLAGGHESHGAPFGTHLFLLLVTFWPISLFLWPTFVRTWQKRSHAIEKFLLAWILPTWIFFELMPTKLPQYILPTFPALAILVALTITHQKNQNSRTTQILSIIWGLISLGLSFTFIAIPLLLEIPIPLAAIWTTSLLATSSLIAVFFICQKPDKKNFPKAFTLLILGNLLGFSPAFQWFLPQLTPVWPSQIITETIHTKIPHQINDKHPLYVIGYGEPSLVFLLGTHAVKFDDVSPAIENIKQHMKQESFTYPEYALVDKTVESHFIATALQSRLLLEPIQTMTAFNYNKGYWITLTLYRVSL